MKRETFCRCLSELHVAFQSTPSVKRETIDDYLVSVQLCISIHSLCEEGDIDGIEIKEREQTFQSTPSVKRETFDKYNARKDNFISIHSLCEEGDASAYNSNSGR